MIGEISRRKFIKLSVAICGAIAFSQYFKYFKEGKLNETLRKLKVAVVGCGGAGNNILTKLSDETIADTELIAVNTDKTNLEVTKANRKILIGYSITRGLGAGGVPEIGMKSAIEEKSKLMEPLYGRDLVFIIAGMGGGTGSGCAPVIAEVAKKLGAFVVGDVTLPFYFEKTRVHNSKKYLTKLKKYADCIIAVDHNKIFEKLAHMPLSIAFEVVDTIVVSAVKELINAVNMPIIKNINFCELKNVMRGTATISVGSGSNIEEAFSEALKYPLLDIDRGKLSGAVVHVIGGKDFAVKDFYKMEDIISNCLNTRIIYSARVDPNLKNYVTAIIIQVSG